LFSPLVFHFSRFHLTCRRRHATTLTS
jgi:hypothetical protein